MNRNGKSLYCGFFAEFYDILHAGLKDIDAYIEFAHKFGPDILELGSGTGRILIPLAKKGFNVTGIDFSDDMIKRCYDKLHGANSSLTDRITIVKQDVTKFELERKFDLIIAPCNMISHFTQTAQLINMLKRVIKHLKPNGVFILDISVPDIPFMVYINSIERIFGFEHPLTGTRIVNRFVSTYDFVNQLEHNSIYLEEYGDKDELTRKANCSNTLTYFFPRELRLILETSGLKVFAEQGSLHEKQQINSNSTEMVFFCRLPT